MNTLIKKDTVIAITCGVYSDYEMLTICKALQNFDIAELSEEYKKDNGSKSFFNFVKWLIVDKRMCDEFDYLELHIGDYRDIDPTITIRNNHPPTDRR